ncbi:MAG: hypothetical protein ACM37W_23235 [Actinomycetota bacterium]
MEYNHLIRFPFFPCFSLSLSTVHPQKKRSRPLVTSQETRSTPHQARPQRSFLTAIGQPTP